MTKVPSKKRPVSCDRAFQRIARACLTDILQAQRSASRGAAEGIHRMRIGFTRLDAARRFFSAMVTDDEWSAIRREIRWLNRILGKARNNDVTFAYLHETPGSPFLGSDRGKIKRKVATGHARVGRTLGSKRYQALLARLRTWIDHGPWTTSTNSADDDLRKAPLGRFASRRLNRWSHRLAQYKECPDESRRQHRVRIQAKRYRHMVKALSELGIDVSHSRLREAEPARQLHRALGDLRDLRRVRRTLGAPRKGPFKTQEDKLLRQIKKAFDQFS